MAVKKKLDRGITDHAQKVTGAKINTKTVTASTAYPLNASLPRHAAKPTENTIERRLEDKAAVADTETFASPSLGQMSREARRKLLFG